MAARSPHRSAGSAWKDWCPRAQATSKASSTAPTTPSGTRPATLIPARHSATDLAGERVCKAALQAELALTVDPEARLFAFASRLTWQKMADVVLAVAPAIAEVGGQLAFDGEGEPGLKAASAEIGRRWRGRIAGTVGYPEAAAHRLLAGADVPLAPARPATRWGWTAGRRRRPPSDLDGRRQTDATERAGNSRAQFWPLRPRTDTAPRRAKWQTTSIRSPTM